MSSSERTDGEGGAKDVYRAFLRQHGLDDDWTVRFTADRGRAREMAGLYRDAGYEVRILPLFPDGEAPGPESLERLEGADHDPLREAGTAACASCLGETYVVLTRRRTGRGAPVDPEDGLVYE